MNLDAVRDMKVLLVGDAIVDEYIYVTPIGKSIKEPVISTRFEREESFHGGVLAAAEHIRELCAEVDVMTGDTLMCNRRYVEETTMRKMFTLHHKTSYQPMGIPHDIGYYDLVIVTDFGHGAITAKLIETFGAEAKYLAVNTQTNSQNFGFNVITKYIKTPRAYPNYVVLDELEIRLATHDNVSDLDFLLASFGHENIVITRGSKGAWGFDGNEFYSEDGKAVKVVDTIGAGDAALAISAPFAAAGFPMCDLVRIANAAGAAKCQIIGHRNHVTRKALEEQLAL